MGWCYAFGVAVKKDHSCTRPMEVVEGADRCACPECEVSCDGLFPACATTIFVAGGRELQARCTPPSLVPAVVIGAEAGAAEPVVPARVRPRLRAAEIIHPRRPPS